MVQKTYNPIIREEEVKISFFPKLPVPGINKAILMLSTIANSAPLCITRDANIKVADIRGKKYNRQIEIDMQPHDIGFKDEFISQDNVSKFTVTITATASVTNPEQIYENHITDVCSCIEMALTDQIQEIAANYSIDDNHNLRHELKEDISSISYFENGISLRNVNVVVRVDEKYQQFLAKNLDIKYQTELESSKAKAGKKMKEIYDDQIAAIFSGVAAGEIGVEEAITRSKANLSKDFDERMRQIKEVTAYIKSLEQDEMIDNKETLKNVNALLNGMMSSISNLSIESSGGASGILEDQEQKAADNIFRPFEDEDED